MVLVIQTWTGWLNMIRMVPAGLGYTAAMAVVCKHLKPQSDKSSSMVHLSIDVSEGKKRKFKSLCAEHGDNMSTILKTAIDDYIASKTVHIVKS